jgi:hypothetical protein
MDVGALRKVLKRYGHWRLLQDHVRMLSETGGAPSAARSRLRNRSACSRPQPAIRSGSTSIAQRSSRRTRRCAGSR